MDLEKLREIFRDPREWIGMAKITKVSASEDRSVLRCLVEVMPEKRPAVARMSWDFVGPNSGIMAFPAVGDLVLIAFVDGQPDQCFVVRRLTSKEDKIPLRAMDGDLVLKSLAGKNSWLTSDAKILLSHGDDEPTQNLVLGQELKTLLSEVLSKLADLSLKLSTHTHSGNLGYPTSPPTQAADFIELQQEFNAKKSSPVDDQKILSDFAFTEKGS